MKRDTIEALGIWSFRILLTGGAIYAALIGNDGVASACTVICVLSFFLLD